MAAEENKFHKSTFDKIDPERKQRIIDVAVSHFAKFGFKATNINNIASDAGISIGSMYSYFESKDDLFLTIGDYGYSLLARALSEVNRKQDDHLKIFEELLRASRRYALEYPEMNQVYLEMTTQGMSSLSEKLSYQLEDITAKLYHSILKKAQDEGRIDPAIDINVVSFCLDNLIMMFQYSYTSDYYRNRMRIFLGDDEPDEEDLIEKVMLFIKRALTKSE
ncbi:TetR/AcrR family transcriptional regulator [Spirochaeta isovalerica]|uniref:AcrR family transcriptional regulator n=1 Tax=Spirochaeta isovalerica TaxID=150 RepID=A0A841RBU8_9SPIO|nr:TetR/AcrR family transcriptional regulator [Spirochaeta isovalerica]MBB6481413.1 AcrR family transcriptional regulator [Spirochaeta isovalerica]